MFKLRIEENLWSELKDWLKKCYDYLIGEIQTSKSIIQTNQENRGKFNQIAYERSDCSENFADFSESTSQKEQQYNSAQTYNKFVEENVNNIKQINNNAVNNLKQGINGFKQQIGKLLSKEDIDLQPYHKLEMINTTAKLEEEDISKRQEVYFNEMKERMKKQSQGLLELKTAISVLEPIKKELRNGICCYKATVEELLKPFALNSAKEAHPEAICIKQLMSEIKKMENKVS
uniref:Uncharacterized protein n=1 Tax=Glossina morsitans morsitans TaxID=37546 RepID=A0A1B0FEU9_GLOMM